jgi:hypothetical protein
MSNIYVGNLSFKATEDDLREAFSEFGTVSKVNIIIDRETNRSRGFGFVEMPDSIKRLPDEKSLAMKPASGKIAILDPAATGAEDTPHAIVKAHASQRPSVRESKLQLSRWSWNER